MALGRRHVPQSMILRQRCDPDFTNIWSPQRWVLRGVDDVTAPPTASMCHGGSVRIHKGGRSCWRLSRSGSTPTGPPADRRDALDHFTAGCTRHRCAPAAASGSGDLPARRHRRSPRRDGRGRNARHCRRGPRPHLPGRDPDRDRLRCLRSGLPPRSSARAAGRANPAGRHRPARGDPPQPEHGYCTPAVRCTPAGQHQVRRASDPFNHRPVVPGARQRRHRDPASECVRLSDEPEIRVLPITDLELERRLYLLRPKRKAPSEGLAAFLPLLDEEIARFRSAT